MAVDASSYKIRKLQEKQRPKAGERRCAATADGQPVNCTRSQCLLVEHHDSSMEATPHLFDHQVELERLGEYIVYYDERAEGFDDELSRVPKAYRQKTRFNRDCARAAADALRQLLSFKRSL